VINCRVAAGSASVGSVASAPPCKPTDTPTLISHDPTCFDGDAARGIFVSTQGNNANPGTMAAPMRTLAAGIAAAFAQRKDVYVTQGDFKEVLVESNGVSVYGGYDTRWQRSPANVTKITGAAPDLWAAAVADGIVTQTTLQLLTFAPPTPTHPGVTAYGLVGDGSPRLTLDHVTVAAPSGVAGPDGANGAPGAAGGDATTFHGGTSPAGNNGGEGGAHGSDGDAGGPGTPGLPTTFDQYGRRGGPAGDGGQGGSNHTAGVPGWGGDSGVFQGDGTGGSAANAGSTRWVTASGTPGKPGTDGDGGGGGGGGGADSNGLFSNCNGGTGGGGGGGGQHGGGGEKGQGGGGSFGIFLVHSTGAVVRDSTVKSSDGAAGGAAGRGALGGAGGLFAAGTPAGDCGSPGAHGGLGGPGGRGGDGGGGAGGPSIAIYGVSPANAPGTTVHHGKGGAGGAGGGGNGADGKAANFG
jgi:hypothetical protein